MRHPKFLKPPVPIRRKAAALAVLGLAAVLLSACETDGSTSSPLASLTGPAKKEEAAKPPEPPMTRSRAASECWMATEKGRADADLDKRADAVTKCIDQKMKTAAEPPKT
ncbi:MAG TPA: hypothetical protein VFC54_14625 [Pseudolabrys sp.]|nr:hypothetical protein [Pseudolabrys sp.]